MGKQLFSSGFIAFFFIGWMGHPTINQENNAQREITILSSPHQGDLFQAEIDILNQTDSSIKLIRFPNCNFGALFRSTLFSYDQVANTNPKELNEARKKLLLSLLYPTHEFS